MSGPKFSVVIPLFNREREIVRALTSCQSQMTDEFEVVVVDDASSDGSVAAVQEFLKDRRISLIVKEKNAGEWSARTTGIDSASGEWIIWLDSDDEFVPGGLASIRAAVEENGSEFDRIGFEYIYDSGGKSPLPGVASATALDLAGYIRWYASVTRSDALWVTRRETFNALPLPKGTGNDLLYAFNFNARYRTLLLPVTVGLVHTDSGNRVSSLGDSFRKLKRSKADLRRLECDALLEKYGADMLAVSAAVHKRLSRARVVASILAGRRWIALKNLLFHARHHVTTEVLSLLLLLLAGPRVTYFLSSYRKQRKLREPARGTA